MPIDAPLPVDEDGEVIAQPAPFEAWLRIESSAPERPALPPDAPSAPITPVGLRPTFTFTMNQHVDDESFTSYGLVTLSSGGLRVGGTVTYQMSARTLVWRANRDVEEGLVYAMTLQPDALRSVTGSPPQISRPPHYVIAQAGGPVVAPPLPVDTPASWSDVRAIFAARCDRCHSDPAWQLPPLTPEGLIGARSSQVDRVLVRPFDPSDSYLMHKLLPEYRDRHGSVQPPPWDDGSRTLSREELWIVERWIAGGGVTP